LVVFSIICIHYNIIVQKARCRIFQENQNTTLYFDDSPKESCGVVGVYSPDFEVAQTLFYALYALQHRGQESAGITTSADGYIFTHKNTGLVSHVFQENDLSALVGKFGIGHTRYSTTGSSNTKNSQPINVKSSSSKLSLAHNGNIVNAIELKKELELEGVVFTTSMDSEVIAHLINSYPSNNIVEKVKYAMRKLKGAYSLTILYEDKIIGVRDPFGVRPLCIGKIENSYIIASETCALDHVGAEFIREVESGEIVILDKFGLQSSHFSGLKVRPAPCIFEYIYFARPDSIMNGKLNYSVRRNMGIQLAKKYPVEADVVIGVPDSAIPAAIGYAFESGIPYSDGLIRNRYVGRTFIQPEQRFRVLGASLKYNTLTEVVANKRIVVLDDSIVRGTTTPQVLSLLKSAGAKEIHMRVCAPPITNPCHFGVDLANKSDLIAAQKSVTEIKQFIGADSLHYLSIEECLETFGGSLDTNCTACFTGDYPIPVQLELDKMILER
tara:strand:+ start:1392 stop:2885 length:1494 start_codon:yes stop_codon:yes gene_type:complete